MTHADFASIQDCASRLRNVRHTLKMLASTAPVPPAMLAELATSLKEARRRLQEIRKRESARRSRRAARKSGPTRP